MIQNFDVHFYRRRDGTWSARVEWSVDGAERRFRADHVSMRTLLSLFTELDLLGAATLPAFIADFVEDMTPHDKRKD